MPRNTVVMLALWVVFSFEPTVIGDDSSSNAPIRVVDGLFDQSDSEKLGLPSIPGEHTVLYLATEDTYKWCHEQNICVFDGKVYVMWSNGILHECSNGQRILYAHTEDGVHWSEPAVLVEDHDGPGEMCSMPSGFHAHGNTLVAYYTATVEHRPGLSPKNALYYLTSQDGRAWSSPQKLTQSSFLEGPRALPSGRLLMNGQWASSQPRLRYSDSLDGIAGWKDAAIPMANDVTPFPEPSWFVRSDGSIVMIFRAKPSIGWLYASVSSDNGETWSKPLQTNFPDATSRAYAGNLPDGTAYIINNPNHTRSSRHPSIGRRIPLTIALSEDGTLFDRAYIVRAEPTSMRFEGSLKADGWQYPAAVAWKDHLYIAYSINKEDEAVTRIALSELLRR